jgi:phosphatidylserine/phosphatidylglycerophosphate/cardiolipin synthase-like enzyme
LHKSLARLKSLSKPHLGIVIAFSFLPNRFSPIKVAVAARCVGGDCTACTTCSGCVHCSKKGGTCSVCARGARRPASNVAPTRPRSAAPRTVAPTRRLVSPPKVVAGPLIIPPEPRPELVRSAPTTPTSIPPGSGTASVEVYFSPRGGAQAAIIREIDGAKEWIRLQAYSYTSAPISEAVVRAIKRGVKVKAILDKSNVTAQYSGATFLANAGATVKIDSKHAIAHSKIMIIDGKTVITGSFNFTKSAEENNAENLLVMKDCPELVNAYSANFRAHDGHSAPYAKQ